MLRKTFENFVGCKMDCAPNVNIFSELQVVHDTGYFSSQVSPEEDWQQVKRETTMVTLKL